MSFTLPIFNCLYDLWRPPNAPPAAADFTNQPCQFYFTPKGQFDIVKGDDDTYRPPIYLRVPKGTDIQVDDVVEVEPGSGLFYTVRWVERVHLNFPNEYFVAIIDQGVPAPPGGDAIILEIGDFILQEDGTSHILVE